MSYQEGHIRTRRTKKHGLVHVIGYRAQRADGTWKQVTETIHTQKRKQAKEALAKRLADINGGEHSLPSAITFAQFISEHWEPHVADTMKPSTRKSHESNTRGHLLPALSGVKLKDIQPTRLAKLLHDKQALSYKSRLNLYLLMASMFAYAVSGKLLKISPLSPQDRPKPDSKPRREKPTLSASQIQGVIAAVPLPHRALFVLLALTGLRIGEVLGLKWADIDLEKGRLYVRRSMWMGAEQSTKSPYSDRGQFIVGTLAKAILMHRALAAYTEPDNFVFSNGAGRPHNPDDLRKRVLYPAMDRAGITRAARSYGFHIFRHSAGTEMQQATNNLKTTSSFLGHASIGITGDVYSHTTPEVERAAMEKLESATFPEGVLENLLLNVVKTAPSVN